ncbi:hypothetical protein SAMN05880558_12420 [Aeromonas sp. RU39B]|uniref:hypothetical protein n=1 Tax=Aeromonas sp. RU39B TaxID=1907416 RepID=UPI0009573840|nr:hypothetical protein [Aeromonas sp. RU39B]SIR65798.1 hypothetical protein SAMN05880558_12420 [Aeromonas sp. RU39B]
MTHENTLLAELEGREALDTDRAEWIAQWVEDNRPALLRGELDTTPAVLLAEVNKEQDLRLNQALFLLMTEGEQAPLMQLVSELIDAALLDLAADAWSNHCAQLEDGMSEEAWERYQQRSAA